jgi:glutathionylspermidine synthase
MERIVIEPRADWQKIVEGQGFHYHTSEEGAGPVCCWDETAYCRFSSQEIDLIEKASYALNDMCLKAVQHVIDRDLLGLFHIPPFFRDFVRESWNRDEYTVYGRFDLTFDGQGPPKLLEYNADTPTALLEAAVIQWYWLQDRFPQRDQFNSIHERLIEIWSLLGKERPGLWYFTSLAEHVEDYMTVSYLRDTAIQAGVKTEYIPIEKIGWNNAMAEFTNLAEKPLTNVFKLYPWEWMLKEQFGPFLLRADTRWLEAPWKMLLSNKAILTVLSELFPDSPYLLHTAFEPPGASFVRKPILGREGANITVVQDGRTVVQTEGIYADSPCVYQQYHPLGDFAGNHPVVGSWMVNGYACGIGIREDRGLITGNTSRFVPHIIGG